MINKLFTFSSTIERLRQGPLSEYLDAYATAVAEQGYRHDSIRQQIVVIADFSHWLKQKRLAARHLDTNVVDRFLRLRRQQQRIRRGDPKALGRLLAMLRQKGLVKPHRPPVADTAQSRIVAEFRRYLLQERGLSPLTLLNYIPVIEQFLSERFHNRAPNFATLRAADVTRFVTRHAHQLSPLRAGLMVTALRSFFRYLRHRGAIATDLAGCVPTVPNWSLSTLPRFLPAATVERILECCDRKTSVGRRNHAILLLLARLGVRAGEVVGLSLDDIDWSTGQITGRKIGPAAVGLRRRRGPCRLFTSRPSAVGHPQCVPSPPGSVSRPWELIDGLLARQARHQTCRRGVGTHRCPCASTLPGHEPASAGRLAG